MEFASSILWGDCRDSIYRVPGVGDFPHTGRFCEKPPGNGSRVGAGAVWMWGEGPCGRPLLEQSCSSREKPTRVSLWGSGSHKSRAHPLLTYYSSVTDCTASARVGAQG